MDAIIGLVFDYIWYAGMAASAGVLYIRWNANPSVDKYNLPGPGDEMWSVVGADEHKEVRHENGIKIKRGEFLNKVTVDGARLCYVRDGYIQDILAGVARRRHSDKLQEEIDTKEAEAKIEKGELVISAIKTISGVNTGTLPHIDLKGESFSNHIYFADDQVDLVKAFMKHQDKKVRVTVELIADQSATVKGRGG